MSDGAFVQYTFYRAVWIGPIRFTSLRRGTALFRRAPRPFQQIFPWVSQPLAGERAAKRPLTPGLRNPASTGAGATAREGARKHVSQAYRRSKAIFLVSGILF
jgi:hypothetical protein